MPVDHPPPLPSVEPAASGDDALVVFARLEGAAAGDRRLKQLMQTLIEHIDDYAEKRRRHVVYADRRVAQFYDPEKFKEQFHNLEVDREEAHNQLIETLGKVASHAERRGLDVRWWKGRRGLLAPEPAESPRGKIDNWAMEVWLGIIERREREERGEAP